MGRLTDEIFPPSCCDGGECSTNAESSQPCGCDPGANWVCYRHRGESLVNTKPELEIYDALGVSNSIEALIEIDRLQQAESYLDYVLGEKL